MVLKSCTILQISVSFQVVQSARMSAWSQLANVYPKKYADGKQFNGKDNRTGDGLIPRKIGNAMAVTRWDVVMKISKHSRQADYRRDGTDGLLLQL